VGTQGVTFTVQMVQPPKTAVDEVRVLIHPRQPPGLVYGQGGPDNDPAVTRRLSVKGHWDTPGLRQFTLHWDGRDKHGHPVAKGPYLLEAVETIRSTVQVPCRDGGFGLDRTAALSGGGLGTLDVT
jgi:hypothetical protein